MKKIWVFCLLLGTLCFGFVAGVHAAISDYNSVQSVDVKQVTGTPSVEVAIPVYLEGGGPVASLVSGTIPIDFRNITDTEDIAFYDKNDQLLNYEVEHLDVSETEALVWVSNNWARDGTTQLKIAYGSNSADTDRQSVEATWGDSVVGVHHLEESSGGPLDSTSNDYDSNNIHGSPTRGVRSPLGPAWSFDGSSDRIDLGDPFPSGYSNANDTRTVVVWTQYDNTNDFWVGWSWDDNDGTIEYEGLGTDDSNGNKVVSSGQTPGSGGTLSGWNQQVFVYDGSDYQLYLDGSPDNTQTPDSTGWYSGLFNSHIAFNDNSNRYLPGDIAEIRIYSRALSSNEVKAHWDATASGGQSFFEIVFARDGSDTWFDFDWGRRKEITISASIPSDTFTDFPTLVQENDEDIKTNALSDGSDIIFTDTAHEIIPFEIEEFDDTDGVTAWVNPPQLNGDTETTFYVYYDGVSNQLENSAATFNRYGAVYHMSDDPSSGEAVNSGDSQSVTTDIINGGMTSSDLIGGTVASGWDFDGNDDEVVIDDTIFNDDVNTVTMEALVRTTDTTNYAGDLFQCSPILGSRQTSGNGDDKIICIDDGNLKLYDESSQTDSNTLHNDGFIADGEWHYVAWQSTDQTTGGTDLWRDGVVEVQPDIEDGHPANRFMEIAGAVWDANNYWTGDMDEVRITTHDLGNNWITTNWEFYRLGAGATTFASEETLSGTGGGTTAPSPTRHYQIINKHYQLNGQHYEVR